MPAQRTRWTLVATLSLLASTSCAQTIVVDGKTVSADYDTVAPAVDSISSNARLLPGFENLQLTDNVLANLTNLQLSNISLFHFDDNKNLDSTPKCKSLPGDLLYPGKIEWKVFDLLTGGALIKTVPLGAACYDGEHYDAAVCDYLLANWSITETHVNDPSSLMSPLFAGATCQPQNGALGEECTLGGFPEYSVNVTTVAQIQLAVNFARSRNIRLVVRNTGHDFLGRNTGKGALSLWTHHLNDIEVMDEYESADGSYKGPAFKMGAGVLVHEMYEVAEKHGYTGVGGECRTVGVTGGYTPGGGHSPVSSLYGMAADQVLSVDIVTPDGRFITADDTQNTDLFWAIRGGGAATWGVVTSMTVRVHEKIAVAGMAWDTTTTDMGIDDETFWKAIEAYWSRYPEYAEYPTYGYCRMSGLPDGGYAWRGKPFMIPGMTLRDFKKLVQPLLDEWEALGVDPKLEFFEYDNLYSAWKKHFPTVPVGGTTARTANRLLPRKNWEDAELLNKTIKTVRSIVEDGAFLVHYNINGPKPEGVSDNAVNPAWRDTMMFNIIGVMWDANATEEEIAAANKKLTGDLSQRLKDISPGAGAYNNEGDLMDPEWQESFYGQNYDRLLEIKKKIDPRDLFWAPTAVGSEGWAIVNQENDPFISQDGRLCRVSA
ncbi:uncharacterized protein F5Z01DRAFT_670274 [Emericellopsis atlantica]|uniref:FAD-binding PCMH-type domain-containing protein n=1 Tax=Emericellopsis atlantica TaxID=2614577 RepID=A0A9P7ZUG7_9HYPO|nr:uncharacterized protein F5Z01DRAFT_670274 [Emericellopsis atlantica]KAG9258564.1 hypothetical protein F5Z01DRAFT_670274 [Emericellopsis atlantica]